MINPFTSLPHMNALAISVNRSIRALDDMVQNAVNLTPADKIQYDLERKQLAECYAGIVEQRAALEKTEEENKTRYVRESAL